jgi:hypothetical protein
MYVHLFKNHGIDYPIMLLVSQQHRDTYSNCLTLKFEGVMVRRSRWNAPVFKFKCDHGPHTMDFYLSTQVSYSSSFPAVSMDGDVGIPDHDRKRRAVEPLTQNMPNRRVTLDYVEKDSSEFKVWDNV